MKHHRTFILYWVVNAVLFYFLPFIAAGSIVTGNARLTPFLASIISGFLLSVAMTVVTPITEYFSLKVKELWQWLIAYFVANTLGVWVIARYADLTGVGVASIVVVVGMGITFTCAQWAIWQITKTGATQ